MAIRSYNPTSPGRRFQTVSSRKQAGGIITAGLQVGIAGVAISDAIA